MRKSIGLVVALALVAGGCAKKSDLDSAQAELETCQREKAVATSLQAACQEQLTTEQQRWTTIEQQLQTALPETLRSFEEERTRLIEAVPATVQAEVGRRFDDYVSTVAREFASQRKQLQTVQARLDEANATLAALGVTAARIDSNVASVHGATLEERKSLQARMAEQDRQVARVVSQIVEFDTKNLTCDDCRGAIKMRERSRDALSRFHAQVIDQLQSIATRSSS